MAFDKVSFEDETDGNNAVLSVKEIILLHIKKISNLCCNEFTEGYWIKKPMKVGDGVVVIETYQPDTREAYCNAIDFLLDISLPFFNEADMKDLLKLIEDDEKEYTKAKESNDPLWTSKKLVSRRKMFKELNKLYEFHNFWKGRDSTTYKGGRK